MRLLFLLALAALPVASAPAQSSARPDTLVRDTRAFSFYDRGPYRASIPRPETILGYETGAQQTQFLMQERVLLAIADAAKDRVRVEQIGWTNEGRPMRLFLVSSPENIARLDAIRADLDRLADPRGVPQAELDAIAARVPAVVMVNESVHGNEAPGFEAAMQTLYHLAASDAPATTEALRNVLVVLNPSTNPDGHERFAVWYNSIGVHAPEPFSLEKDEPWSIQGRFNHYRFDMNRDVMTTTQREARTLVAAILRWHPMVAIDQHGQVSNYFFPPTASPMNANVGRDFARWMEIYGKGNAAAFDRYGWMYFVRNEYDLYGPFYWDSWPSLTGAIGMTYETDGGGWKGILWRREDGTLLSNLDGIAKHYTTALATIETTAANKAARVRDWVAFRQGAVNDGRTGTMKRVVLLPGRDPGRTAALVSTLVRGGIEVRRVTAPFSAARAHRYADDATVSQRFDAGAYVVDLAQPQGRVAKAILEPSPSLDTAFARAQLEKYRRNIRRGANERGEGYEFYDVTAWSLPVTFGVEAYWTEDAPPVSGDMVRAPAVDLARRDYPSEREQLAVDVPGGVTGERPARSAYLFTAERNGASRLAYQLMAAGYRVSSATRPIGAGGRKWPRGTYVVRVSRNDSTLHADIDRLARESGVEVTGIGSAYTDPEMQYGTGSEVVVELKTPRIALVGDEGIGQTSYGATWYVLERRYGIKFTPVSTQWIGSGDLSEFNVILVPDASPGALNRIVGKSGADRLRDWVRAGGTLVTMGGATAWAAREDVNLTSARLVGSGDAKDTTGTTPARADTGLAAQARDPLAVTSPSANNGEPQYLPGSHFDVVLDRTHWLTQGYEDPRLTVMLDGSAFLSLSKEGANVGVFPSSGPLHRAGWSWPQNTERLLRGTAFLIDEPTGRGHVVLFTNEPLFRAWWHALDRLVLNAVLLGPGM